MSGNQESKPMGKNTIMNNVHLEAKGSTLQLAREIGGQLSTMKALCPRGTWLETLATKTEISARQAQKYLKIYKYWKLLPDNFYFTIDDAYEYITNNINK